eukprot:gene15703-21255_t
MAESWIKQELKHGKSSFVSWGRDAMHAIDMDDYVLLYNIFTTEKDDNDIDLVNNNNGISKPDNPNLNNLLFDINTQTNTLGYGGYLWTPWIHSFLGDTILHIAIKQKKMRCIHMLLLMDIDTTIPNANRETAQDLMKKILFKSYKLLQFESIRYLITNTHPFEFHNMPSLLLNLRNVEKEAWDLMKEGRCLYTNIPKSFQISQIKSNDNNNQKEQNYFSFDNEQHAVEKSKKILEPPRWMKLKDASGGYYYYDQITGQSRWDEPAAYREYIKKKKLLYEEEHGVPYEEPLDEISHDYLESLEKNKDDDDDLSDLRNKTQSTDLVDVEKEKRYMNKVKEEREKKRQESQKNMNKKTKNNNTNNNDNIMSEEEKISQNIELEKRNNYNNMIKERMNREKRNGISETPAVHAIGDVWGRDNLSDVIKIIIAQKRRQKQLIEKKLVNAKGLSLLSSVRIGSTAETIITNQHMLYNEEIENILTNQHLSTIINQTKGIEKLKFMDFNKFRKNVDNNNNNNLSVDNVVESIEQLNLENHNDNNYEWNLRANSNKLLKLENNSYDKNETYSLINNSSNNNNNNNNNDKLLMHEIISNSIRDITSLSTLTNMKYMRIGDDGLDDLSNALKDDNIIKHINLSNAKLSSKSILNFSSIIPFMYALEIIDLSYNNIDDEGAIAISNNISKCLKLSQLSLGGNRITIIGALDLIQNVFNSKVKFLSLKNNAFHENDYELIFKMMEEFDFEEISQNNNDNIKLPHMKSGQSRHTDKPYRVGASHSDIIFEPKPIKFPIFYNNIDNNDNVSQDSHSYKSNNNNNNIIITHSNSSIPIESYDDLNIPRTNGNVFNTLGSSHLLNRTFSSFQNNINNNNSMEYDNNHDQIIRTHSSLSTNLSTTNYNNRNKSFVF